ncbi:MAG: class I SAM-dependent DNA methyltransferase, partial [bacterium]
MNPVEFIQKWSRTALPERAASQEHFIDLCRLLGQPTPAEHDATGAEYTFEKGVAVTDAASRGSKGESGFADVWWKGKFAWEYKRKDKYKDLTEAYRQLCQYREALENPPLLVVCDIERTEIHTNFTGTAKQVHTICLEELDRPEKLALLRRVFTDPDSFRPDVTAERITREVADQFGMLAGSVQQRGHDPQTVAHFLMKCMFCLFAEDVQLLPSRLFSHLLKQWKDTPAELTDPLSDLFAKMRTGGAFGPERIAHFNGGLFDESPALELTGPEIEEMLLAGSQDWSSVEPAIFGTLFERSLDPSKRSQIGAHYTSREDILLIVEPVVMAPLRARWDEIQQQIDQQLQRRRKAKTQQTKRRADQKITDLLSGFLNELGELRILDPACGSGNFLYVAIQRLLDLEKEVITRASGPDIALPLFPTVRPTQLHGLEINPYAVELAQVVIWIGYLQWMRDNGFNVPRDPILEPIRTIELRDAILDLTNPETPRPAHWPDAHFIIGNPPFLGSKMFRQYGLDDDYLSALYAAYPDLPNSSDLCCYWFERARQQLEFAIRYGGKGFGMTPFGIGPFGGSSVTDLRIGLLATQGIRGGTNREVLKRIKETGDIFFAWSDREWVLDGAAVHVSMIGFDNGSQTDRSLDGKPVQNINSDLTGDVDLTAALRLAENQSIAFMGDTKVGPFDIDWKLAHELLKQPNPHGKPNAEVLRPWVNGRDITARNRGMWIVDFPPGMPLEDACQYEAPFAYISEHVRPMRKETRSGDATGVPWWVHQRPRPDMRSCLPNTRCVATPNVTKYRLFAFLDAKTLPDHQLIAFARDDDYFFGVLQSGIHELWARRQGTQLREAESGFRYTPTSCFETFPLPWPPGSEPGDDDAVYRRIAEAARALDRQRRRWLNPPEWID